MKKIVFLLMASLMMTFGYADEVKNNFHEPDVAKITAQIYDMLSDNFIPDDIRGSKAEVRVAVDKGNYLRILSVETDNEVFEKFIRTRVDFQKLTRGNFEKDVVYRIPIEVKK